jgi:hypothetical protein
MTEAEWMACTHPTRMLECFRGTPHRPRFVPADLEIDLLPDAPTPPAQQTQTLPLTDRKVRLFACACCRRAWASLTDPRSRQAVEVAEAFVECEATEYQLYDAWKAAYWLDLGSMSAKAARMPADWNAELVPLPLADQAALMREIILCPERRVDVSPLWRTSTVLSLAHVAYRERALPEGRLDRDLLAILADALEDAGCSERELLDHLRSDGFHVRGCWALDLLLGKG